MYFEDSKYEVGMVMPRILVQGRNRRIAYVANVVYIVCSKPSIVYRVILSQFKKKKENHQKLLKLLVSLYE